MTDTKKEKTLEDFQREYSQLCQQAGHLNYQVFTLKNDIERINETLREVNLEAAKLQAKTKEEQDKKDALEAEVAKRLAESLVPNTAVIEAKDQVKANE